MMEAMPGIGQRFDPVQPLKRMVSCVAIMLLVPVAGNNGLILWQQG
jgi:hypothetical protein